MSARTEIDSSSRRGGTERGGMLGKYWKAALVVVGVGLAVALCAAAVVWHVVYTPEDAEPPPCAACAVTLAEARGEIPTVTVRDLRGSGRELAGRLVRVRAWIFFDSGTWSLADRETAADRPVLAAAFATSCAACAG